MSRARTPAETWNAWRDRSRKDAEQRWSALEKVGRPKKTGKDWLAETRRRLIELASVDILQPREQSRVAEIHHDKLASADQDRLGSGGFRKDVFAFAVAAESAGAADKPRERALRLSPGKRLRDGKLSFQVFIDERSMVPVGMNIQIRGEDPARRRPTYLRYDLDVVAMGEKAGPVTHFRAHWHSGDDPDAGDAEDHDPRLPSLLLDPLAVLDVLIETFFPGGPGDVEKPSAR